jgi:lysophospholipase L1-like esterase
MIGCDMFNKGIPGACLLEPGVCDYIANSLYWNYAILELGVNMIMRFTPDDFEKRVTYFLEKLAVLKKPVFVTGIFTSFATYTMQTQLKEKTAVFNKIVESVANSLKENKIFYISGEDALSDFSALCCDLIHPSDDGHILIAQKMASRITTFL